MRKRGFSLLELSIYMFLFALVMGIVLALMQVTRKASGTATSSQLVNGTTDEAVRWLRQDLQEAALASVVVGPGGISMISSRAYDPARRGELLLNPYGAPLWDKHVFYALDCKPGAVTGNLVRWERELAVKNLLPAPSPLTPASGLGSDHSRVVLNNVVAPGAALEGVGNPTIDAWGGFRAQFVRRIGGEVGAEQLANENPTAGNPRDNTRVMELELEIYQAARSHSNYYALKFRVAPRY